ncbi:MAG: hypothetical protein ACI86H_000063 [bacterium]|jgi:hypothetical protein
MNKLLKPNLLIGLATGFGAWLIVDIFLFIQSLFQLSQAVTTILSGTLLGTILGLVLGSSNGFFHQNILLLKRGAFIGSLLGALGGFLSFGFANLVLNSSQMIHDSSISTIILHAQRWISIGIFIGLAVGFIEKKQIMFSRGIYAGLIASTITAIFTPIVLWITSSAFITRGFSLISFSVLFSVGVIYLSIHYRKTWLRALNGKIEGLEFELTELTHCLGSQDNDDIHLNSFQYVNPTHAKLIQYDEDFALLDNDPFSRTFVNFRPIEEQALKNGDILKIGSALFQYCQKPK